MARAEIEAIHAAGRLPILVGGTGLYLRTLLDGIAPVPPIDPEIRAAVRAAGVAENFAALTPLDPCAAARLNPATRRGSRARSRWCGRPGGRWPSGRSSAAAGSARHVALAPLILLPPRDWLVERCDRRFAAMVEAGRAGRGRGAAGARARPRTAGDARDRGARAWRACSTGADARAGDRRRARSRRGATPSANIPGSPTSPRRSGRAGPSRSTTTLQRARWRCSSASALARRHEAPPRRRHRPCPAGRASASRSSATATRAARRRSTSPIAGSTSSSGCATARRAPSAPPPTASPRAPIEEAVAGADLVMLLAPDETLAALYREIEPHLAMAPRSGSATGWRSASARSCRAPTSTCSWSRPRDRARRCARSIIEGKGMVAL